MEEYKIMNAVIAAIVIAVIVVFGVATGFLGDGHRGAPTGSQLPPPPKPKPSGPWYFVVQYTDEDRDFLRAINADRLKSYKEYKKEHVLTIVVDAPTPHEYYTFSHVYRYDFLQASELGGIFLDTEDLKYDNRRTSKQNISHQ